MELRKAVAKAGKKFFAKSILVRVILVLGAFGFLAASIIGFLLSPAEFFRPAEAVVTIPPSASAREVGVILSRAGLVRSPALFGLYARIRGLDSQIKAGQYRLSKGLSTPVILSELISGRLAVQVFTIPEGFTTEQIADLLAWKELVERDVFLWAVAGGDFSYPFLKDLPAGQRRFEGYLFPDTYEVRRGVSEEELIRLMLERFEKEIAHLDYISLAHRSGLSLHQAVTVASMVEREAQVDEERPLIAGVIFNRLKNSMPLQIDATVQYALGAQKQKIYTKDLRVKSPYNTYLIKGLPPGPIAMPGRASLLAAVSPARIDYLYYVARPDGTHAFAKTLAEHNANKKKYQQ